MSSRLAPTRPDQRSSAVSDPVRSASRSSSSHRSTRAAKQRSFISRGSIRSKWLAEITVGEEGRVRDRRDKLDADVVRGSRGTGDLGKGERAAREDGPAGTERVTSVDNSNWLSV